MILPSRKLLFLLGLPIAALVFFAGRATALCVVGFDVAVGLLALVDLAVSAKSADVTTVRETPARLSLGADNPVGFRIVNRSSRAITFALVEDLPESWVVTPAVLEGTCAGQGGISIRRTIRPLRRGLFRAADVTLRFWSPLGLVVRQGRLRAGIDVKVYPNVVELARRELSVRHHRTELGFVATRVRGEGRDFESLRDYVPGDNPTDIAWKATARRGRLITRNFQAERSQNVLVVLDCGRLMTTEVAGLSRLDHAINGALLLSYVTMKQGDYIGLLAFADSIEAYLPPVRGGAALGRMNEALYRLEARPLEADYGGACEFLALRHRKRSLIVIVTDVVDNDASSTLLSHAARFARYHLPLCVTLRNLDVERFARAAPLEELDPYRRVVALGLLQRRRVAIETMRRSGVDVLDVDPRSLGPSLIGKYLELKARHRI